MYQRIQEYLEDDFQSTFYFFNPPYTVTGVVKDPPVSTNLPFDALLFHDLLPGIAGLPEEMQWL